jgi:hypothetical protein
VTKPTRDPDASDIPVCPNCKATLAPLPEQDRQALALANAFAWTCPRCLLLWDGETAPMPLEEVLHQERNYYLTVIAKFIRPTATRKELLDNCEVLRQALATGSAVRWAWANVAPELLRELWGVMDRIGGTVPSRPIALMSKPRVGELDIQQLLQAISDVVSWCSSSAETVLPGPLQYVTLDQMAAILQRNKRTLERLKTRRTNPLPLPDVEGGGGRADEWLWHKIRPWLEQESKRILPERYPGLQS